MTRKKLACVASVSARVCLGKLGREQKKKKKGMTGEGREGEEGYVCPQTPRFWKTYLICGRRLQMLWTKKKYTVFLSVNVFSTKVLIGDTIFTSPNGDGTAILRGHPSHAKVSPLAVQRKYLHFSVILRPWVNGPAPGIELATSRSAVKRSTDWASSTTVTDWFESCLCEGLWDQSF